MIKLVRVDYRLLHGQVVFAWTNFVGADCILIACDEVAQNENRKSALRLAKPASCKLVFKSVAQAVQAINSGVTDKYKLLILVETIGDARKLCEGCPSIRTVNLGLSKQREGTREIGKAVYATPQEEEDLKALSQSGVVLEIKQAPNDKGEKLGD